MDSVGLMSVITEMSPMAVKKPATKHIPSSFCYGIVLYSNYIRLSNLIISKLSIHKQ